MSTGYQITEQDALYYLTLQVVDWVDVFSRERYRKILTDNLSYCIKHKQLRVFGWVIMSKHMHLLAKSDAAKMSQTLRDFKSYTSKVILNSIASEPESRRQWLLQHFKHAAAKHQCNSNYQFWTHENHAVLVYSNSFMEQKLDYIHQNPVRAGIVKQAEEYIYSSATDYVGNNNGLLPIEIVTKQWKIIS